MVKWNLILCRIIIAHSHLPHVESIKELVQKKLKIP